MDSKWVFFTELLKQAGPYVIPTLAGWLMGWLTPSPKEIRRRRRASIQAGADGLANACSKGPSP